MISSRNMHTITSLPISKRDHTFAELALNVAQQSEMLFRHGCVCTINGKVVSTGCNNYRTQSKTGLIDSCSCHAEMDALRKFLTKGAQLSKGTRLPKGAQLPKGTRLPKVAKVA